MLEEEKVDGWMEDSATTLLWGLFLFWVPVLGPLLIVLGLLGLAVGVLSMPVALVSCTLARAEYLWARLPPRWQWGMVATNVLFWVVLYVRA
jgi:hypothetical protein